METQEPDQPTEQFDLLDTTPPLSAVQDLTRPTDEDAAKLELGPEFESEENAQPIFYGEAAQILVLQVDAKKRSGVTDINPVLSKSLEYATRFGGPLTKSEQAIAVRNQLVAVEPKLHAFEISQLASLLPKDAEEAKAIIPSLAEKYDDSELNDILAGLDVWT